MSDSKVTRPLLRYHGGKYKIAHRIIPLLPAHRVYVEPFGGAASILLRKERSYAEVYNDIDSDVYNLFRVLRQPAKATRLRELLELTPYSREEFENAYVPARGQVEQARLLIVRAWMGHGAEGATRTSHRTGFRLNTTRSYTTPCHDWANFADALPAIIDRLRNVVIENRDGLQVMMDHDGEDTLHYCDPPYVLGTRHKSNQRVYRHEMTDQQHRELACLLHSLQGMVVLSGYASDLYADLYEGWSRMDFAAYAHGASKRTECLWFNPAADARRGQTALFGMEQQH